MIDEFEVNGGEDKYNKSDYFGFDEMDLYVDRVFVNEDNVIRNFDFEVIC